MLKEATASTGMRREILREGRGGAGHGRAAIDVASYVLEDVTVNITTWTLKCTT